jgi:hypothetical protein
VKPLATSHLFPILAWCMGAGALVGQQAESVPRPPAGVQAFDHPWDGGDKLDVVFDRSPDDRPGSRLAYTIERAVEYGGLYRPVASVPATGGSQTRRLRQVVEDCRRGEPYYFRVRATADDGAASAYAETTEPVRPLRQWFDGDRAYFLLITLVISGSVVAFIVAAKRGRQLYIRRIAGLEAVDEAVGRATEMGRSCLFVPGVQDMNDIQTIAGMTVLSRVAQVAAEHGAQVEVPTSRSLVMTTAQETVQSAFLAAGRPDAYDCDQIYYVTDEQFGFVAYLSGMMARQKPAACFYMGSFFAESLILAESGNAVGAIQVAGTAMPAQLPFFVAACDYTLIGEEFFAASAYLSGEPDQLGSLKGQDVGKLIVGLLILVGCGLATAATLWQSPWLVAASQYLRETVLK